MSRKNRNARRSAAIRKNYEQGVLAPSPTQKMFIGATSQNESIKRMDNKSIKAQSDIGVVVGKENAPNPSARSEMIRCDDRCVYQYVQLPVAILETDVTYQRKVDMKRVQEIIDNFDPRLVNEIKVSNRDGHYYIFDGSHTLAALKMLHHGEHFAVDCKLFMGLTYEDEAYLFALQRGESKKVAFSARLRAMLISGRDEAMLFKKSTESAGFKLNEGTSNNGSYTIAALAKAYKIFLDYGSARYEEILKLLGATFGGVGWSVTSYILGGVAVFLREYGSEYKRDRFIKRLRGVTYDDLRDEARRQMRGSSDVAHALALVKAYNRSGGIGTVDPRKLTMLD